MPNLGITLSGKTLSGDPVEFAITGTISGPFPKTELYLECRYSDEDNQNDNVFKPQAKVWVTAQPNSGDCLSTYSGNDPYYIDDVTPMNAAWVYTVANPFYLEYQGITLIANKIGNIFKYQQSATPR